MGLTLSAAPAQEPVDLDAAKAQLRLDADDDDHDDMITSLIAAARMSAEQILNRSLITQTWVYKLDAFPATGALVLPKPPLQSVASIAYIDGNGDSQTWDSAAYDVFPDDWTPRVAPVYGGSWPTARAQIDAVSITFVAGYGDTGLAVPRPITRAILLMIDRLYADDCGGGADGGSKFAAPLCLLTPYRLLPV